MNVLLVANGYPPYAVGGVEVYTAGLAQTLRAQGHRVSVISAEGKPDEPDYEVLEAQPGDVPLFRLINNYKKIHSFSDIFADRRIDEVFSRLLDRLQPDLVHFNHLIALSARLPLITTDRGIPSLFTAHDFWALCQRIYLHDFLKEPCPGPRCGGDCYKCITSPTPVKHARTLTISTLRNVVPFRVRSLVRKLLTKDDYFLPDMQATPAVLDERYELFRTALQATGRIVVPSEFVKQMFVANGYREERFEVLPLGMTTPARSASPRRRTGDTINFAFVGAILPWKGSEVLARAFMATHKRNIRLTYYGREDIIPAFSRSLRRLTASDRRIRFAGAFQPENKDAIYEQIDVLVIPSTAHESFSLVAREALLRGVPVIAARVGALPEVISDGVNGFLTRPGDVEALSALLGRLGDHPEMLTSLQLPGPVTILSVDQHVERLLGIYDTCRALPS